MVLDETAVVDDVIDLLVERQALSMSRASRSISARKAPSAAAPRAPACGSLSSAPAAAPQRAAGTPGALAQQIERARADAAHRQVDDALERGVIVAIGDQSKIGERILDFGALEEAQAAVDAIRQARLDQRLLEHPRLRVGAVQDRAFAPQAAAGQPLLDAAEHEVGLVALVVGAVQVHRFAARAAGPQVPCRGASELLAISALAASRIAAVER